MPGRFFFDSVVRHTVIAGLDPRQSMRLRGNQGGTYGSHVRSFTMDARVKPAHDAEYVAS